MANSGKVKSHKILSQDLLRRFSVFIQEKLGASYPKIKADELGSIISKTAASRGFAHTVDYAEWILSDSDNHKEVNHLASHLTVGETYFFRHREIFDSLEDEILPEALEKHPQGSANLRIWSAGCSSGEEPYSIAISLERSKAKLPPFDAIVYASDINRKLLTKAQGATYTKWSFRETPDELRDKYFSLVDEKYFKLKPEVVKKVSFSELNLLSDDFPSYDHPFGEMDIILCRNVLIYFDDNQIQQIVKKLYDCLRPGGWLITAPAEAPVLPKKLFESVKFKDNFFFRRRAPNATPEIAKVIVKRVKKSVPPVKAPPSKGKTTKPKPLPKPKKKKVSKPAVKTPAVSITSGSSKSPKAIEMLHNEAVKLLRNGKYREAAAAAAELDTNSASQHQALELASAFADVGNFEQARHWLDAILLQDNLCVMAYYHKALVLMAEDDYTNARKALQQALFLKPDFPAAYFTMGTMLLSKGKSREAGRIFAAALKSLGKQPDTKIVEGTEDMTVGEMKLVIHNLQKKCN